MSPASAPNSQVPVTLATADGRIISVPIIVPSAGNFANRSSALTSPRIKRAASMTASTKGLYPVQRQAFTCFENQFRTSSLVGLAFSSKSCFAETMNPGVQNPH